ncbi:MAG TPA: four helix bundle protein [Thermoanaerobaculia bacterium]|nr:four helix bundle protein [Thermoanaerobaculia bacterium]
MEIENPKSEIAGRTLGSSARRFDLEERTLFFALAVRDFVRTLPRDIANVADAAQVIRSSGSVGANYIEANEALSKKDFLFRIKICRKEAKESGYGLTLIDAGRDAILRSRREALIRESGELTNIFGAILRKTRPA